MQLASTTADDATEPGQRLRLRSAANQPAAAGVIAFVVALGLVVARLVLLAGRDVTGFMLVGNEFARPSQLPAGVRVFRYSGYDGQFYYRMALDPANLHRTANGITMDYSYRFVRIGYSALAWVVSAGQHSFVPFALVAINIVAFGLLGLLGGMLARESGRHAMWGLLLAGYFGLMTGVSRDLTEPLGAVCLLAGILAYRRRHPVLAAAAFAYGCLTRETVLIAPIALFIVRIVPIVRRRARPSADDLAWLVPGVVFVAWEVVLKAATGVFPILSDGGKNAGVPLTAAVRAVLHNFAHPTAPISGAPGAVIIWDLEIAVLGVFAIAALWSLRTTTVPVYERVAFLLYLVEMFSLAPTNWDGYADLRSFVEVYLLAGLILLGTPRRRLAAFAACAAPLLVTVAIYRTQIWLAGRTVPGALFPGPQAIEQVGLPDQHRVGAGVVGRRWRAEDVAHLGAVHPVVEETRLAVEHHEVGLRRARVEPGAL